MQIDVIVGNSTRNKQFRGPIYRDHFDDHFAVHDTAGNVYSGFWAPDSFGQRYVGDRTVTRTVQVSNARLRLLDSQRSRQDGAVFKASAVYENDNEDVVTLVPYLVCAVFDNFPGQYGVVRILKFDSKTGAVIKDR